MAYETNIVPLNNGFEIFYARVAGDPEFHWSYTRVEDRDTHLAAANNHLLPETDFNGEPVYFTGSWSDAKELLISDKDIFTPSHFGQLPPLGEIGFIDRENAIVTRSW